MKLLIRRMRAKIVAAVDEDEGRDMSQQQGKTIVVRQGSVAVALGKTPTVRKVTVRIASCDTVVRKID